MRYLSQFRVEVMKMCERIIVVKQGTGEKPNPLAKCCAGGVGQMKTV